MLLLPVSCYKHMDPFEGGDGVHINLNGKKCTMVGFTGNSNVEYMITDDNTYDIISDVTMIQWSTRDKFGMYFHLSDNSQFETGKKYHIGGTEGSRIIIYPYKGEKFSGVSLEGEIEFLNLADKDPFIEALFELDGTSAQDGKSYTVRHGYFNLIRNYRE